MLHWEERGAVAVATIDRPEARNALNADLCDELRARLDTVAEQGLRAVVITGAGDKAFSSGADLARRRADTDVDHDRPDGGGIEAGGGDSFRPAFEQLGDAMERCPAPIIAAINGVALGAGLQLAVLCDLRIINPAGKVGIPATHLGVLVSAANIARLLRLVGLGAATDVLLTGRRYDAPTALAMGLVHRVEADPLAAATAWAEEIATLAPLSVAGHKRALQLIASASNPDPHARAEIQAIEEACFRSEDLQAGLAAFAAKRPPEFRGR